MEVLYRLSYVGVSPAPSAGSGGNRLLGLQTAAS
jgi:hypothetical protein